MGRLILVLLVACMAGLASYSAMAEPAPRSIRIADDAGSLAKKHKPAKAPASCADNKDKHDCVKLGSDEGACAWCEGQYMPASCMSAMAAKYLPETVAKCKLPKEHKEQAGVDAAVNKKKKPAKAPASCADNKDKHDCVKLGSQEGDCAWCEGRYMPASCMSAMAAKYLPETVAKCKLPKEHKKAVSAEPSDDDDKPEPKPKPPTSCGDNKEKDDCLDLGAQEGDCAWCKGDLMPPSCVGIDAAKWIPETVAHCKVPKGKKDADVTDTVTNIKSDSDDDDDDDDDEKDEGKGGDWPSGGGDWPSGGGSSGGGGDYPYGPGGGSSGGGGDYPYGPGGGSGGGKSGGKGCKELKSRHKCMKGSKSEGACAWCEKSFVVMSGGCVPESMIKWLPKMVADCEVGEDRRKKKDDAVQVA